MKQRAADFIADFLADNGITHVFSVVGGGAMHLNNAFGLEKRLNVVYNHHEQASAIAAESYSRIDNKIAAVCVTSGPGGTNALTGVLCAWQDSLPVIVISGQVRNDITVDSTGLDLRQFGEQEYYITRSAAPVTKYAVMVTDAKTIKYHLAKALHIATTGRRGPVWIDVPLNIQGQTIDTDELLEYVPEPFSTLCKSDIDSIVREIGNAKRPVFIAGSGLRTSGALVQFRRLADKLNIPVICPTSTVDYYAPNECGYFGMFGTFGGRVGNFIAQNADLLVTFAARLSFKQIGFNFESFAPNSRKIVIDADSEELKKPTIRIDVPICADVADVITALSERNIEVSAKENEVWFDYCTFLKSKFVESADKMRKPISAYRFSEIFFDKADNNAIAVLGNNTAAVSLLQCGIKKHGQRIYGNVNCGTMGYDLPAAIGASIASGKTVFCLTGEGSFQMNLQELQTVAHNKLPVKIVIFNNNSYQAIVQTQINFFDSVFSGCTNASGISFPSFAKLADCYDFPFKSISASDELDSAIDWFLNVEGRAILELVQTEADPILPKLSSKKLDDGSIVSPPIDDLYPFLSKEEYAQCQFRYFAEGRL
ncbi:MAG: thiamine pyrophosphate-binding protein [Clostridiales bacterium]|jgi:acetolactate synthase-1/2/3 large subunit|nr:thiamine pyrophosphate-binding protein [Clostridiales bacterium]